MIGVKRLDMLEVQRWLGKHKGLTTGTSITNTSNLNTLQSLEDKFSNMEIPLIPLIENWNLRNITNL